jgi:hypothetical protein
MCSFGQIRQFISGQNSGSATLKSCDNAAMVTTHGIADNAHAKELVTNSVVAEALLG